jgi:hypothetical protein
VNSDRLCTDIHDCSLQVLEGKAFAVLSKDGDLTMICSMQVSGNLLFKNIAHTFFRFRSARE